MKTLTIIIVMLTGLVAHAEPTMKGTPGELAGYLNKVPRTVSITTEASDKVTAKKAQITLMVLTESKRLAEALSENGRVRNLVRNQCKAAGINDKDIVESKFSSTPEYGWFGDKPSAFKVENRVTITVRNEQQLIKVAAISDKYDMVHFVSSKALIENEAKIKSDLLRKALQKARQEAQIYEKNLGLKLVPVSFAEGGFTAPMPEQDSRLRRGKLATSYEASVSQPARFGESKYRMILTVNYNLKAK